MHIYIYIYMVRIEEPAVGNEESVSEESVMGNEESVWFSSKLDDMYVM